MAKTMESLAHNTALSQASFKPSYPGVCKSCGAESLFLRQTKIHLGVFCSCGVWQKWIKRSAAHRYQVRISEPKPIPYPEVGESIGPAITDAPSGDLAARVEKLEQAFAGYDREIRIVLKAIWACGVLQGHGSPPISPMLTMKISPDW